MNCETYQELVAAHVAGCLASAERNEADRHLASCAICSRLFSYVQQFQSAFVARMLNARTLIIPVPEAAEQQLRNALRAEIEPQPTLLGASANQGCIRSSPTTSGLGNSLGLLSGGDRALSAF